MREEVVLHARRNASWLLRTSRSLWRIRAARFRSCAGFPESCRGLSDGFPIEVAEALLVPPGFETEMFSFTFFTPGTEEAMRLASFLSFLLGTVPVKTTLPFSTAIWTFCKSGLVES